MATETTNYGLTKPDPEDFYDVSIFNTNYDKIDAALAEAAKTGGGGGAVTHDLIKCGSLVAAQEVVFDFTEIDTISNDDKDNDLTITLYGTGGSLAGTFVLKPGETINDVNYSGSKIGFSGTTVNARYLLLGATPEEE